MKFVYDLIVIAGAPGVGKSTIANKLQQIYKSPLFEFGWIPEFRNKSGHTISYQYEEQLSYENLVLVTRNYLKHGFSQIILTDLQHARIREIHKDFFDKKFIIFKLFLQDINELKHRVLEPTRSSEYRNWKVAIKINQQIIDEPSNAHEVKIDITGMSREKVLSQINTILSSG